MHMACDFTCYFSIDTIICVLQHRITIVSQPSHSQGSIPPPPSPVWLLHLGQESRLLHTQHLNQREVVLSHLIWSHSCDGQFTPICDTHFKEVHRSYHANDDMYSHDKCTTCSIAYIKGPNRLCPDPAITTNHLSTHGHIDRKISTKDKTCTKS